MDEDHRITANPSALQIGFSIFGILFFSTIAFYIYDSEWIIDDETDNMMIWILISLFCFLAIACLYMLLVSKKVELTNETLSISYPYIFQTKTIDFDDVRKVTEENYKAQSSHDFRKIEIYNGRKITLEFFESKKIVITSFEVTNYNSLANNLKNITKTYFKLRIENQNMKSTQGYGWLIFIVILTLGLLISVIEKHSN